MSEQTELIKMLHDQLELQRQQMKSQQAAQEAQMQQFLTLIRQRDESAKVTAPAPVSESAAIPPFSQFDPASELWPDYLSRFRTFLVANAVPDARQPQIFLTNQTVTIYRQLSTSASQMTPPVDINKLTMVQISKFMSEQYDPKRFVVRERFRFWNDMSRKPGESLQELASRIRQDAATCDFSSITDPQDEALRQRFICSVNNEAVLKALFRVKADELSFSKAINIAIETEDAAKVAKETVYGAVSKKSSVSKIDFDTNSKKKKPVCYRCGKNHLAPDCVYKESKCNFCHIKGHLEAVCRKKKSNNKKVKSLTPDTVVGSIQKYTYTLKFKTQNNKCVKAEAMVDTGSAISGITETFFMKYFPNEILKVPPQLHNFDGTPLQTPAKGIFVPTLFRNGKEYDATFYVLPDSYGPVIGQDVINLFKLQIDGGKQQVKTVIPDINFVKLQKECNELCSEFSDIFKEELGCLKDFELDVEFKADTPPVFHKARSVAFAVKEDLSQGYQAGIDRGIFKKTTFNDYGTPVVPIRKASGKLRICGDYKATMNKYLKTNRYPIPLPSDLMTKLGGGQVYSKIDLADAYNQIKLSPESAKKLALSTHQGVLLQQRLPFGITSAPGYFQQIMDSLTSDLPGVAAYIDDLLVTGKTPEEHQDNLRSLFSRLSEKGLRCKKDKCIFAQPSVEYLGFSMTKEGVKKTNKVDAILDMPAPRSVSELKSFLGQVQFYNKFLPDVSTILEPLYSLTRKETPWVWGRKEGIAFQKVKECLNKDTILTHFDPTLPVGVSCDASDVGLGVVLFHRFPDGSERPIENASRTLSKAERNYSQIQKEALAIIYGLKKFYCYIFGRKFILVTDHKPLTSLFSPTKETPQLAANRLARWALWLSQFNYDIEYRRTEKHGNADALSRLPVDQDKNFCEKESADRDMVCTIKTVSIQLNPSDSDILKQETAKDPVLSTVMRFVREGWPQNTTKDIETFRKLAISLSVCNGCLLHGTRVVIPTSLQPKILDLLHIGHFGMEKMKQLARTAVYWPGIDAAIEMCSRRCASCGEHQNKPSQPPIHPWMVPEKPWSRIHIDHAINFMGTNWLVLIDAYTKYPCVHATTSVTTKSTIDILQEDFSHFGFPHTIVTDNAPTFTSGEFQSWCRERGIIHLTGAPYHPATNGAAERLVQSFKQSLRKSSLHPKQALQEFLMQYRRTPNISGFSPSELLNSRQLRTRLDTLLPSPAHVFQSKQSAKVKKVHRFQPGDTVYAEYFGPRHDKDPRWVPAVIKKTLGPRTFTVKVVPRGPTWRRHLEQLQPRVDSDEDRDPGDLPVSASAEPLSLPSTTSQVLPPAPERRNSPVNSDNLNLRRSRRNRKAPDRLDL